MSRMRRLADITIGAILMAGAFGALSCFEQVPVGINGNAKVFWEDTQICDWRLSIEGSCAGFDESDIIEGTWRRCKNGYADPEGRLIIQVTSSEPEDEPDL